MKRLLVVIGLVLVSLPAAAQEDWTPAPHHTGAHFSIGRNYTLPRGDIATGTVVVVGGTATIDGHVEDDVVVIGGDLIVGPTAEIDGDATAIAGHVTMDPMARVHGDANNVGVDWPRIDWPWAHWTVGEGVWRVAAIGWTSTRLLVTLILCVLLALIFPRSIGNVAARIESAPGSAFAVGFLSQLLLVPALIVISIALIITIIGIVVVLAAVPVVVAVFVGLWVAGFTAASATLGASLRGVVAPRRDLRIGDVLIGFLVLTACTLIGQVLMLDGGWLAGLGAPVRALGACIEYVAWTVGLGAAVTALFGHRHRDLPPPLPTVAVSPKTF